MTRDRAFAQQMGELRTTPRNMASQSAGRGVQISLPGRNCSRQQCRLGTGWPSSCPAEQDLGVTAVPNTRVSSVLSLQTTQTAWQATLGAAWPTGGDNSAPVRLQLEQSCTLGSSDVCLSGPTSPLFRCTSQKARLSLFLIKSDLTQGVKF